MMIDYEKATVKGITDPKDNNPLYRVEYKGKTYLVKRVGKCEPKKCKAACCKFVHVNSYPGTDNHQYFKHFGERTKWGIKFKGKCSKLCKNKCKLWGKRLPEPCKQFPVPIDPVYWEVKDVCTFGFMIVGELILNEKKPVSKLSEIA